MRDSLTVLAILVILVLTAALVGPYFIDWNSHRAEIEQRLSRAAGAPITIGGAIDVKLLPTPVFRLGDVGIGEPGSLQPRLKAKAVDVEISLAALLRGEVEVTDARLEAPELTIPAPAAGARIAMPGVRDPGQFIFRHVSVEDGTIVVERGDAPPMSVGGLAFDAEATSLYGPFKAAGSFSADAARRSFRLVTGAFDGTRLRARLTLEAKGLSPSVEIDGTLRASGTAAEGGTAPAEPAPHGKVTTRATAPAAPSGPGFAGQLTLTGSLPLPSNAATVPWRFAGHVDIGGDLVKVSDIEWRAGTDMRSLIATGEGEGTLGDHPSASVHLHGGQLDLDSLAVAPDNAPTPAPAGFALLRELAPITTDAGWAGNFPLRLDLDAAFDTATVGGDTFSALAGRLQVGAEGPPRLAVSMSGPEASRLDADGTFEPGPKAVFRGRVDARGRNLARFGSFVRPAFPALGTLLSDAGPLHSFSLGGTADISEVGVAARDLSLSIDRSTVTGTLSFTRKVGHERPRLFADLAAETLDLDGLPALGRAGPVLDDLDLSVALVARGLRLRTPGAAPVESGRLALRLTKVADEVHLDTFDIDLAGARLSAKGDVGGTTARLEAHVAAEQAAELAALARRVWPGAATAALDARAAMLSPLDVTLAVAGEPAADGAVVPTSLHLEGLAGGTTLSLDLKPDEPEDFDPYAGVTTATLRAEAPDAASLLQQIGLPLAGAAPIGPGTIEAHAHGSVAAGFDTGAVFRLGESALTYEGRAKPGLGSGRLTAAGRDVAPVLRAIGLLQSAGSEQLSLDAAADLSWHDANVALRHITGRAGEADVSGDLNADLSSGRAASRPAVFGALSFGRLPLASLVDLGLGPSGSTAAAGPWPDKPFGPPLVALPRTEISLRIGAMPLWADREAGNASLTLRADRGTTTLADLTATLGSGTLGGTVTLRRDGPLGSVSGQIAFSNAVVDTPVFVGRVGGSLDVAGSGRSLAAIVDTLAGTGRLSIADGRILRFDPEALVRTAAAIDRASRADPDATSTFDPDNVSSALSAELDRAALPLGNLAAPATLATGVLRVPRLHVEGDGRWGADLDAGLDLRTLDVTGRIVLRARAPIPDWTGSPPEVTLNVHGRAGALDRSVDVASFVNGLQARAIQRDQDRIEIIQQDARERAFFNRVLKRIESEQAAEREKVKAEADAERAAEIERRKAEEAARTAPKAPPPPASTSPPVPRAPAAPVPPAPPAPVSRPSTPGGRPAKVPGPAGWNLRPPPGVPDRAAAG